MQSSIPRRTGRKSGVAQALHIDRKQHLELAWQRQQGEERLLNEQAALSTPAVLEVRNLAHLDQLVDKAGSAVVLLFFYSKVAL